MCFFIFIGTFNDNCCDKCSNQQHYYHEPSWRVIQHFMCNCEGNSKDEEGINYDSHYNRKIEKMRKEHNIFFGVERAGEIIFLKHIFIK